VSIGTMPLMQAGLVAIAPINSTASLAAIIRETPGAEEATIVFEAPIEYQSCAGLNFYLERRIVLLKPPGFVAPPYLEPHRDQLFLERAELERRWNSEPILFVSDPLAPMNRALHQIVPDPFFVVARTNNRWLVSNRRL
jgi:hypothetical protein